MQRTIADAEAAARSWPQPWADAFHLTRVDVACDVTFVPTKGEPSGFTEAHRELFTSRGTTQSIHKNNEMRTLYIGSRQSPVMLRIYLKSEHCNERDRERWREHGWSGRTQVWRIEYEFHKRAIPQDITLPDDVGRMWSDGLARIRMCAVPPRTYCEQNKAPTHPWWKALGHPVRVTRRACDLAKPDEATVKTLEAALDRLCVRGGAGVVPVLLRRLLRHNEGVGKKGK